MHRLSIALFGLGNHHVNDLLHVGNVAGNQLLDQFHLDRLATSLSRRGVPVSVVITNLTLWEMPTWWSRQRRRPTRTMVVTNPQLKGYPRNVPSELAPAHIWTGVVRSRPDVVPDLPDGKFYVGVSTSHHDRGSAHDSH